METALTKVSSEIISNLVLKGDLSGLTAPQRVTYYNALCERVGLDPLTQPFSLLSLQGKVVLYANKSCTEQLRKIHSVSITDITPSQIGDIYVVTVRGKDAHGKTDGATGAVTITGLKGDALANAMMKAETKAKRRFTLSICGLAMLDESEVDSIPGAVAVPEKEEGGAVSVEREVQVKVATDTAKLANDDVQVPFGPLRGKRLGDCPTDKLRGAVQWAKERDKYPDFVQKAEAFLSDDGLNLADSFDDSVKAIQERVDETEYAQLLLKYKVNDAYEIVDSETRRKFLVDAGKLTKKNAVRQ